MIWSCEIFYKENGGKEKTTKKRIREKRIGETKIYKERNKINIWVFEPSQPFYHNLNKNNRIIKIVLSKGILLDTIVLVLV